MATKVYHTTGKDDWGTEQALFDCLDQEFAFTLDAAAEAHSAKCDVFLSPEIDALQVDWWGRVFLNPPFTQTAKFLEKLALELLAEHLEIAVALVAARPDTAWFQDAQFYARETRYVRGRLRFEVYPTEQQRGWCASLQDITIEPGAWPKLVQQLELPKTAIQKLIQDPGYAGPDLATSAPFPSAVLVFDRGMKKSTVYWDWRKGQAIPYAFDAFSALTQILKAAEDSEIVTPEKWMSFGAVDVYAEAQKGEEFDADGPGPPLSEETLKVMADLQHMIEQGIFTGIFTGISTPYGTSLSSMKKQYLPFKGVITDGT